MNFVNAVVEVKAQQNHYQDVIAIEEELQKAASSFRADKSYPPVPMQDNHRHISSYIIRGGIEETQVNQLKQSDAVIKVYQDTPIAPF